MGRRRGDAAVDGGFLWCDGGLLRGDGGLLRGDDGLLRGKGGLLWGDGGLLWGDGGSVWSSERLGRKTHRGSAGFSGATAVSFSGVATGVDGVGR
jgi:hypothetical protein